MKLSEFRNRHAGQDIYVIGSGATLSFYDASFFDDCVTVAINQGWQHHLDAVDYMVTKYHGNVDDWKDSPRVGLVVTTRKERGHVAPVWGERDDCLVVDHNDNPVESFDPDDWPKEQDALVVSHSSITTGMHFAAYLGARRLFIVGADCGSLDGRWNIEGHLTGGTPGIASSFERHNRIVKKELENRYDVRVVSLLPFTTPNMDGHRFESHAGRLN